MPLGLENNVDHLHLFNLLNSGNSEIDSIISSYSLNQTEFGVRINETSNRHFQKKQKKVELFDQNGYTIIHRAVLAKDTKTLRELIYNHHVSPNIASSPHHFADFNHNNNNNNNNNAHNTPGIVTPLVLAIRFQCKIVIELLLQHPLIVVNTLHLMPAPTQWFNTHVDPPSPNHNNDVDLSVNHDDSNTTPNPTILSRYTTSLSPKPYQYILTTPLIEAINNADTVIVSKLLNIGALVNYDDRFSSTQTPLNAPFPTTNSPTPITPPHHRLGSNLDDLDNYHALNQSKSIQRIDQKNTVWSFVDIPFNTLNTPYQTIYPLHQPLFRAILIKYAHNDVKLSIVELLYQRGADPNLFVYHPNATPLNAFTLSLVTSQIILAKSLIMLEPRPNLTLKHYFGFTGLQIDFDIIFEKYFGIKNVLKNPKNAKNDQIYPAENTPTLSRPIDYHNEMIDQIHLKATPSPTIPPFRLNQLLQPPLPPPQSHLAPALLSQALTNSTPILPTPNASTPPYDLITFLFLLLKYPTPLYLCLELQNIDLLKFFFETISTNYGNDVLLMELNLPCALRIHPYNLPFCNHRNTKPPQHVIDKQTSERKKQMKNQESGQNKSALFSYQNPFEFHANDHQVVQYGGFFSTHSRRNRHNVLTPYGGAFDLYSHPHTIMPFHHCSIDHSNHDFTDQPKPQFGPVFLDEQDDNFDPHFDKNLFNFSTNNRNVYQVFDMCQNPKSASNFINGQNFTRDLGIIFNHIALILTSFYKNNVLYTCQSEKLLRLYPYISLRSFITLPFRKHTKSHQVSSSIPDLMYNQLRNEENKRKNDIRQNPTQNPHTHHYPLSTNNIISSKSNGQNIFGSVITPLMYVIELCSFEDVFFQTQKSELVEMETLVDIMSLDPEVIINLLREHGLDDLIPDIDGDEEMERIVEGKKAGQNNQKKNQNNKNNNPNLGDTPYPTTSPITRPTGPLKGFSFDLFPDDLLPPPPDVENDNQTDGKIGQNELETFIPFSPSFEFDLPPPPPQSSPSSSTAVEAPRAQPKFGSKAKLATSVKNNNEKNNPQNDKKYNNETTNTSSSCFSSFNVDNNDEDDDLPPVGPGGWKPLPPPPTLPNAVAQKNKQKTQNAPKKGQNPRNPGNPQNTQNTRNTQNTTNPKLNIEFVMQKLLTAMGFGKEGPDPIPIKILRLLLEKYRINPLSHLSFYNIDPCDQFDEIKNDQNNNISQNTFPSQSQLLVFPHPDSDHFLFHISSEFTPLSLSLLTQSKLAMKLLFKASAPDADMNGSNSGALYGQGKGLTEGSSKSSGKNNANNRETNGDKNQENNCTLPFLTMGCAPIGLLMLPSCHDSKHAVENRRNMIKSSTKQLMCLFLEKFKGIINVGKISTNSKNSKKNSQFSLLTEFQSIFSSYTHETHPNYISKPQSTIRSTLLYQAQYGSLTLIQLLTALIYSNPYKKITHFMMAAHQNDEFLIKYFFNLFSLISLFLSQIGEELISHGFSIEKVVINAGFVVGDHNTAQKQLKLAKTSTLSSQLTPIHSLLSEIIKSGLYTPSIWNYTDFKGRDAYYYAIRASSINVFDTLLLLHRQDFTSTPKTTPKSQAIGSKHGNSDDSFITNDFVKFKRFVEKSENKYSNFFNLKLVTYFRNFQNQFQFNNNSPPVVPDQFHTGDSISFITHPMPLIQQAKIIKMCTILNRIPVFAPSLLRHGISLLGISTYNSFGLPSPYFNPLGSKWTHSNDSDGKTQTHNFTNTSLGTTTHDQRLIFMHQNPKTKLLDCDNHWNSIIFHPTFSQNSTFQQNFPHQTQCYTCYQSKHAPNSSIFRFDPHLGHEVNDDDQKTAFLLMNRDFHSPVIYLLRLIINSDPPKLNHAVPNNDGDGEEIGGGFLQPFNNDNDEENNEFDQDDDDDGDDGDDDDGNIDDITPDNVKVQTLGLEAELSLILEWACDELMFYKSINEAEVG